MENKRSLPWGERLFSVFNTTFLILLGLLCLFPYITLLAKSLSGEAFVVSGAVGLVPKGFNVEAYKLLLTAPSFRTSFLNTVSITVLGTALEVFFTACVAYAAAKRDLPGRKLINLAYIFTMLFNGGLIPTYLVVKQTGLMNNLLVLVIPGLVGAFNMILMRNYFEALPYGLEESARIDGAGNLGVLFRIVLPISLPSLATIAIFTAVSTWNNYFGPLLYLTKSQVEVLSLFLQKVITAADTQELDGTNPAAQVAQDTFRAAAIFVSALPILAVYPMLQHYFVKGLTLGAIKQ
jgi:putative aldouronate transport system permease protein